MKARYALAMSVALFSVMPLGCKSNDKAEEREPITRKETFEASVTARVRALDQASRMITLENENGHSMTFRVSDAVKRLNEVSVGDRVVTDYTATLMAELRPPTPEEAAHPIAALEVDGRTPSGSTPAAGVAQAWRVVTTVEAVDVPSKLVTLRGPLGDVAVVKGSYTEYVKQLRVGDTIVITFTESLVVALEKASQN